MNDAQAEMCLKRIEIAVAVKKLVACLDAEAGDQAIDRLADSNAVSPQIAVVLRGSYRKPGSTGLEDKESL